MSEIIIGGIAVAAIGACAAVAGAVTGVAHAIHKGIMWLPERAQKELERLERELSDPPAQVTTGEARAELDRRFKILRAKLANNPTLKDHTDAAGRIMALRKSPLGHFVSENEWERLSRSSAGEGTFKSIAEQAAKRFTQANALYVARSVAEVAASQGFSRERFNRQDKGQRTLVMEDNEGRALVAHIAESDGGARVNLDLTGFGDGSCHAVMDGVLKGLAERQIRLEGMRRRSHYRREGVLLPAVNRRTRKQIKTKQVRPEKARADTDARRNRYRRQANQLKVRR